MLTLVPPPGFSEAEWLLRSMESARWFVVESLLLPLLFACLVLAVTGRPGWAVAFLVGAALSPVFTRVAVRSWPRKR